MLHADLLSELCFRLLSQSVLSFIFALSFFPHHTDSLKFSTAVNSILFNKFLLDLIKIITRAKAGEEEDSRISSKAVEVEEKKRFRRFNCDGERLRLMKLFVAFCKNIFPQINIIKQFCARALIKLSFQIRFRAFCFAQNL